MDVTMIEGSGYTLLVNRVAATAAVADDFGSDATARVGRFHRSIPDYCATPLQQLTHLAAAMDVAAIHVKDESQRYDLNAFKVLGASYGVATALAHRWRLADDFTFGCIRTAARERDPVTFVTATDGNHGRAVAWAARSFGQRAVVYVPRGTVAARLDNITALGATATMLDMDYDDAVRHAAAQSEWAEWVLMQDTAWDGYEVEPRSIMQGYLTLFAEAFEQMADVPTHVFVPCGVGSLAGALLAYLRARDIATHVVVVEPRAAACFFASARAGRRSSAQGDHNTIMAGLACGEPNPLAWAFAPAAKAFAACDDDVARAGMRRLASPMGDDPAIVSGESGAVCMGLLEALAQDTRARGELAIDNTSRILLFSTEGDTDPINYRRVVDGAP